MSGPRVEALKMEFTGGSQNGIPPFFDAETTSKLLIGKPETSSQPKAQTSIPDGDCLLPSGSVIIHDQDKEPVVFDKKPQPKPKTATRREIITAPLQGFMSVFEAVAKTYNETGPVTHHVQASTISRRSFLQRASAFIVGIFQSDTQLPTDNHPMPSVFNLDNLGNHLLAFFNAGHGKEGQKLVDIQAKSLSFEIPISSLNPKEAFLAIAKTINERLGFDFVQTMTSAGIPAENCLAPFTAFFSKGDYEGVKAFAKVTIPLNIFRLPVFQEIFKRQDKGQIPSTKFFLDNVRIPLAPVDRKKFLAERRSYLAIVFNHNPLKEGEKDPVKIAAHRQIEKFIDDLAVAVTDASLNSQISETQMNLLSDALILKKRHFIFGPLNFELYTDYEPEILALFNPLVLANMLNRIYSVPEQKEALQKTRFANNMPCLPELFYTNVLNPQTAQTLLHQISRDPFLTARLYLLYQNQNRDFLKNLDADALGAMSAQMIRAHFDDWQRDKNPIVYEQDKVFGALWTDFLVEVGKKDPVKLVQILARAEKQVLGPYRPDVYGVLSRKFFQNLHQRQNHQLMLSLEDLAWSELLNVRYGEMEWEKHDSRSIFAVWSSVFLGCGSAVDFSKAMRKNFPDRSQYRIANTAVKNQVIDGLNQLNPPSLALFLHQLKQIDSRQNQNVSQILIDVISLMDQPKKDFVYQRLLQALKIYFDKPEDGVEVFSNPTETADVFTVLFNEHPMSGVILFKYLSPERIKEVFGLIKDKTTLINAVGSTAIYYYYFGTQPIGVVSLADYDSRQLNELQKWSGHADFDYFYKALKSSLTPDDLRNFLKILSGANGNEKLHYSRFLAEFWSRFTSGKLVLGNSGNFDALSFVAHDGRALELNRIIKTEKHTPPSFFSKYQIELVSVAAQPKSTGIAGSGILADNRTECTVRIRRKDGRNFDGSDFGTQRDQVGDFLKMFAEIETLGLFTLDIQRPDYQVLAKTVADGKPVKINVHPSYLLNSAFTAEPNALGVVVLSEMLKQAQINGFWLNGETDLQTYKHNGNGNFTQAEQLKHHSGRFLWLFDFDWQEAGDAFTLGTIYNYNDEWWIPLVPSTTDAKQEQNRNNVRFVKASDMLKAFPPEELLRLTGRQKNIAASVFTILVGSKLNLFGKILSFIPKP